MKIFVGRVIGTKTAKTATVAVERMVTSPDDGALTVTFAVFAPTGTVYPDRLENAPFLISCSMASSTPAVAATSAM